LQAETRPPGPTETVIRSVGRDEMNLAEFPLALLAGRFNAGELTFTRERQLTLPDGSKLQQSWMVTGAPKFGLPQPSDEDVLLALLKIACDHGFESPLVHFTQSSLLALMHWRDQGWYFDRLEQALSRLKTTSILARNAFWNNATKAYQTCHFGVIDSYQLFERRGNSKSSNLVALSSNWVRFSAEFFSSIQAGYLKPLDLSLYFKLKSAVSKRLFRYLDKKRYQKQSFEINLRQLAGVHLGLSESTCQYASWIKKELDRAHEELIRHGFLESTSYSHTRSGDWKVVYTFNCQPPPVEQLTLPIPTDETSALVEMLVARGVSAATARELVRGKPPAVVTHQIDVFDHLNQIAERRPFRNPAGFLTEAIRQDWSLNPPGFVPRVRAAQVPAPAVVEAATPREVEQPPAEREALAEVRSSLAAETLELLREEAFQQARAQLSTTYRLRKDSPLVDAFLNGLLKERFLAG
jgi:hypothetical protein